MGRVPGCLVGVPQVIEDTAGGDEKGDVTSKPCAQEGVAPGSCGG